MRPITKIILHCSANGPSCTFGAKEIRRFHTMPVSQGGRVYDAGEDAVADVTVAQATAVSAVQAQQATSVTAVSAEGTAQVNAVTQAGNGYVATMQGLVSDAQAARDAAQTAQGLAEDAQAAAESASTDAQGYAGEASTSAGQAAQSASDAADSATAAQASAESIAASAAQIQTNEQNISNIQALLNGTLYREETDSTAAYSKAVPTGAMPYATINEIGGRTVVWNQLADFSKGVASFDVAGITFTKNAASYTVAGTSTGTIYNSLITNAIYVVSGHKYLVRGTTINSGSVVSFGLFSSNGISIFENGSGIISTANVSTYTNYQANIPNGSVVDATVTPSVIDLTLMFGAGNEPSSVAEFEAMFPSIDFTYDAGTLKSAGVIEVESEGKNILDVPNGAYTDSTGCYMGATDGLVKLVGTSGAVSNSDNVNLKLWLRQGNYGAYTSITERNSWVIYPGTYTFTINNVQGTFDTSNISVWVSVGEVGSTYANSAIHFFKNVNSADLTNTFSVTSTQRILITIQKDVPTAQTNVTFNLQLERGSTATEYTPYFSRTLPIPSAVQALPGYGWSAGRAYNYIDFERKVYVQNVGKIVLDGTQPIQNRNFNAGDNGVGWLYPYSLTNNAIVTRNVVGNLVSDKFPAASYASLLAKTGPCVCLFENNTYGIGVWQSDTSLTQLNTINAYLAANPITVYYELATPIETDISSLLTDNTIEVEAGGTLTFRNQNGDDWRVPVPNEETFLVQATPELPSADGTYTLQCTVTDGTPSVTWVTA